MLEIVQLGTTRFSYSCLSPSEYCKRSTMGWKLKTVNERGLEQCVTMVYRIIKQPFELVTFNIRLTNLSYRRNHKATYLRATCTTSCYQKSFFQAKKFLRKNLHQHLVENMFFEKKPWAELNISDCVVKLKQNIPTKSIMMPNIDPAWYHKQEKKKNG